MVSVNIPFPGFYESSLSYDLDQAEELMCGDDSNELNAEDDQPEHLRLTSEELQDCLFNAMDYGAAHEYMARDYAAAFDYVAGEALGFTVKAMRRNWQTNKKEPYRRPSLRCTYEETVSPREYNFTTDRVFVQIPAVVMRKLFKASAAKKHATFAAVIAERFTSRSGFISYYPADLESWLAKPFADWDHNELGTLLIAALRDAGFSDGADYYDRLEGKIAGHMAESAYSAIDHGGDWDKYERLKAEKRAEKSGEPDSGIIPAPGQGALTL